MMRILFRKLRGTTKTKIQAILVISLFVIITFKLYKTHEDRRAVIKHEFDPKLDLKEFKPKIYHYDSDEYKLSNVLPKKLGIKKITDNIRLFDNKRIPLFPWQQIDKEEDRLMNQMRFIPKTYNEQSTTKPKIFLLFGSSVDNFFVSINKMQTCPVGNCIFLRDKSLITTADVLIYFFNVKRSNHKRPPNQIWANLHSESPYHIGGPDFRKNELNWTVNYRRDATVQFPYFRYYPHDMTKPEPKKYPLPMKNYSHGKTRFVASFISNCDSKNGRETVVNKLGLYIPIDTYGKCGTLKCPRSEECLQKLKYDYKFYLAFENSNCRDYITEKFFQNALQHDVLPIVMGAHPEDYKRAAPPYSYIHIEQFKTIKDLANYLMYLDKNDTAYNEYFGWKDYGSVLEETYRDCRLCMMAHQAESTTSVVKDLKSWHFEGKYNDKDLSFYSTDICIGTKRWDQV